MKILVTGANGYLGQGIVEELSQKSNVEVIANGRKVDRINVDVKKIPVDLFEVKDPYNYFGRPDVLLHLAWRDGFIHNSPAHIDDLPKHYSFLKKMMEAGISQVAVMGTMHEIGFYEGSIDSGTPCSPETPYGISKNALRQLVALTAAQKKIT